MTPAPFRPAREIAITTRRIACDDPASYDSTALAPLTMDSAQHEAPQGNVLNSHSGQPQWWPTFTKAIAISAAAGVLLFLADLHLLGVTITAGSAAIWGLARIAAFHHNDVP